MNFRQKWQLFTLCGIILPMINHATRAKIAELQSRYVELEKTYQNGLTEVALSEIPEMVYNSNAIENSTLSLVDTEAIRPEDVELAKRWVQEYKLDAIFSTDGDSDRPLLADEKGVWIRGDVGGILCAYFLNADFISLPVSCNTAVEMTGWFKKVKRTKIGSPYVISQMQELAQENVQGIVVGYEANGGFLLETEVKHGLNILSPLPTRDALIYLLGITLLSKEQNKTLSQLVEELPKRYTYSGRLQNFPQTESTKILNYFSETLSKDDLKERINSCFAQLTGNVFQVDNTDGVRMIFESGDVIHLRPSGNAPEFRCYTESDSLTRAVQLNSSIFDWIRSFNFKQV